MENNIREYDKIKYSDKDMWWAMSKVAIFSFVLLGIYFRFIQVEKNQGITLEYQIELETLIEEKVVYLNDRMDKKTGRIEVDVTKLFEEVEKLKLPNTDEEK